MSAVQRDIRIAAALAALTVAAYAHVTLNDFIDLDDALYITENDHVKGGLTPANLRWAWTSFQAGNWHPLTWLSLQLDATLYGTWAGGYHLTNLLLHTANVVLLYGLLRAMTGAAWRSALAAALFAVHPLHVESVAWVTERKDVLSTFLGLWAVAAYVSYARRPAWGRYVLVGLLLALSLMAKPMLVTLPCLLLLLDFWPLRRLPWAPPAGTGEPSFVRASTARLVVEKLPLFALAAGFGVLTVYTQSHSGAVARYGALALGPRLGNAAVSCVAYLSQTVWPQGLAIYYPHPGEGLPLWQAVLSGLFLAALTAACLGWGRRYPYLPVG
jgi:hypothetical protein